MTVYITLVFQTDTYYFHCFGLKISKKTFFSTLNKEIINKSNSINQYIKKAEKNMQSM